MTNAERKPEDQNAARMEEGWAGFVLQKAAEALLAAVKGCSAETKEQAMHELRLAAEGETEARRACRVAGAPVGVTGWSRVLADLAIHLLADDIDRTRGNIADRPPHDERGGLT